MIRYFAIIWQSDFAKLSKKLFYINHFHKVLIYTKLFKKLASEHRGMPQTGHKRKNQTFHYKDWHTDFWKATFYLTLVTFPNRKKSTLEGHSGTTCKSKYWVNMTLSEANADLFTRSSNIEIFIHILHRLCTVGIFPRGWLVRLVCLECLQMAADSLIEAGLEVARTWIGLLLP